ncbi:subclass B3 metallo-beta-lactamase [Pseudoxanthomonas kalamensis DSM 18571]|uniref:subclass B3 metallo-beta-lactamase n=1 Tax=Pseudoxanthomonas kalamensis TaxID=289483 RepID=UPI001391D301|nr:subclass B3 metallo-beta-lactamase [Pseudoxanthomonas kalamensis]KAF1710555.1 subclass B3 metallo-beta-lactamase [Pseudoxanthomonas kalamensis DSM 18571]
MSLRPAIASLVIAALAACGKPGATRDAPIGTIPPCPSNASAMDGWNDRAPPQRIFGNTWYVGTCGLASILATSPQGHVLIDGATEAAGPLIEANIRALGFDPKDVKYLLDSHEHHDHVAGLAYLQAVTGAPLLARMPGITTLGSGRSSRDDPQMRALASFPPVARIVPLADGETVRIGELALTAHATPGHAPGGTSWSWRSCEGERCLDMVYADSLTAISDDEYRYGDDDAHPGYLDAFRRGIEALATLPCDVLITPHPLASNLFARMDGHAELVDPGACRRYAERGRDGLQRRLADEAQHQDTP